MSVGEIVAAAAGAAIADAEAVMVLSVGVTVSGAAHMNTGIKMTVAIKNNFFILPPR
jgi:hypothetical protein